jgi:hypothetical protein
MVTHSPCRGDWFNLAAAFWAPGAVIESLAIAIVAGVDAEAGNVTVSWS